MDEQERDELLWRLDERTKRVDENLDRLHEKTKENRDAIDELEEIVGEHESEIALARKALLGLGGVVSAAAAKVFAGLRFL